MKQFPAVPIDSARLREEIRVLMNNLADSLATGEHITDWAAYQRGVGKMEGYALIERLLIDQVEQLTEIEET